MISRRFAFLTLTAAVCSLPALACQKVPLLAPSGSSITLTAAAATLPMNGSTDIIAQVLEASGTPPQNGTLITFTTTLGTIEPSEARTNGGRVIVKFNAGSTSGTANITASSGGATVGTAGAVKIAIGSAAVDNVALSVSPSSISSAGGVVTLTAVANDASGNRLPGIPVTFSATAGQLGTTLVTTDSNGTAVTTLTTSRQADVTAAVGAKNAKVTIGVNTAAAVTFGAFSPAAPIAGQPVSFTLTVTAAASGASVQSVRVDFGDGTSQSLGGVTGATSLSHIYGAAGTYTLTATVTDSNGDRSTGTGIITVLTRPQPTVTITASSSNPLVGAVVTFTVTPAILAGSTATIQSVVLDFGDNQQTTLGPVSSATAVPHVYSTAGVYTVTASVRDSGGGTASATTVVFVGGRTQPTVTITSTPSNPTVGAVVTFTVTPAIPSSSTATVQSVSVDFGDGQNTTLGSGSSATQVGHVYQTAGTYTATATVRDSVGGTGSASIIIVVGNRPQLAVSISASASPTTSTATTFTIAATASTGNSIKSIVVDFGDGSSVTLQGNATSVQHTYTATGTYTVTATATDTSGATGSGLTIVVVVNRAQLTVTISASASPTTASPTTFTITATASTGSTIQSVAVNFGDGSSVTLQGNATSVQHTFSSPNTYTVTATATDTSGATGTASTIVVVTNPAPVAEFTFSPSSPTIADTVQFNGSDSTPASSIVTYAWDFGDGATASSSTPTTSHKFPTKATSTTYTVRLTVTDNAGRTATKTKTVTVSPA